MNYNNEMMIGAIVKQFFFMWNCGQCGNTGIIPKSSVCTVKDHTGNEKP
jgi:hypothetical protein